MALFKHGQEIVCVDASPFADGTSTMPIKEGNIYKMDKYLEGSTVDNSPLIGLIGYSIYAFRESRFQPVADITELEGILKQEPAWHD